MRDPISVADAPEAWECVDLLYSGGLVQLCASIFFILYAGSVHSFTPKLKRNSEFVLRFHFGHFLMESTTHDIQ